MVKANLPESGFELREQEFLCLQANGRAILGGRYPKPETAPKKLVVLSHQDRNFVGKILSLHLRDGKADVVVELVTKPENN